MGQADPAALRAGADTLNRAATDIETASQVLIAQSRIVEAAAGPGPFGPAVSRFAGAWGGELLSWSLGAATLAKTASENAKQFQVATGG